MFLKQLHLCWEQMTKILPALLSTSICFLLSVFDAITIFFLSRKSFSRVKSTKFPRFLLSQLSHILSPSHLHSFFFPLFKRHPSLLPSPAAKSLILPLPHKPLPRHTPLHRGFSPFNLFVFLFLFFFFVDPSIQFLTLYLWNGSEKEIFKNFWFFSNVIERANLLVKTALVFKMQKESVSI